MKIDTIVETAIFNDNWRWKNCKACAIVGLKFCAINRRLAAKQRVGQAAGQLISGAPTINQNQNGPGHVESCHLLQIPESTKLWGAESKTNPIDEIQARKLPLYSFFAKLFLKEKKGCKGLKIENQATF